MKVAIHKLVFTFFAFMLISFEGRAALTIETVHERSDGERYPVQLSLQHIEQDGESRLLAVAMDVSRTTVRDAINRDRAFWQDVKKRAVSLYLQDHDDLPAEVTRLLDFS